MDPPFEEARAYSGTLTLSGGSDRNAHRVSVLTALLSNAESKVNHIDELRQKNMNVALLIFAGLFGFALRFADQSTASYTAFPLACLMLIFCLLDRRLHKISHGWQGTGKRIALALAEAINDPLKDVSFPRYYSPAEGTAQWFSLQPTLYYLLVAGGALSWLMFRWVVKRA